MTILLIVGAALGGIGMSHVITDFREAWPRLSALMRKDWRY